MRAALGFVLTLAFAGPAAAQYSRVPYLQMATEDGVTVVWRTATDDASNVCYGSAPTR